MFAFFWKSTCVCFRLWCALGFMFSCQICVEYDGIRAAVHVTILVLREHSLNLKNVPRPDVIVKCVLLIFFLLFILYKIKMTWQANSVTVTWFVTWIEIVEIACRLYKNVVMFWFISRSLSVWLNIDSACDHLRPLSCCLLPTLFQTIKLEEWPKKVNIAMQVL